MIFTWFERHTPKWVFKQRFRRGLVVSYFIFPILLALFTILQLELTPTFVFAVIIVFCLTIINMLLCRLLLTLGTRGLTEGLGKTLDEREMQVRNKVYYNAFNILIGLVTVSFLSVNILPKFGIEISKVESNLFIVVLVYIGLALPTMVLAWTQPDSITDLE